MEKLRVAILSHGGVDRALELLSDLRNVELVGVFMEMEMAPRWSLSEKVSRSIYYDGYLGTVKRIICKIFHIPDRTEKELLSLREQQKNVERICEELKVPYFAVDNYHSHETIQLLKNSDIDLGVLYGTNIIKESVFDIPKLGTINLHQGLAPFYRGGPPIFWELLNGEDEIGVTIHYVTAKVDTGDIILQETFPLAYDFSSYGLDYMRFLRDRSLLLAEPSAKLMVEAVKLISEGFDRPARQDLGVGKRYRLPSKSEKNLLVRALKKRRDQVEMKNTPADIK